MMMNSDANRLKFILELQKKPKNIRNISVVAHVDHGKTTLSDSLISSNNIFSKQLVGELHYLDSREDEQQRGITMKSSAISLIYREEEKGGSTTTAATSQKQDYLINLIDSPGHVEFSSEVSSALRLTDGALVLVDVVEGISAQTYTVLKQCFQERVKSVLVLNKMDKLKYELFQTPEETYQHLKMLIEQVNAIISSFANFEKKSARSATELDKESTSASASASSQQSDSTQEQEEEDQFYKDADAAQFSPEKGNIVFCSALDCWSFRLSDFAEIFAEKLEIKKEILTRAFWGEYYYNPKTKRLTKDAPSEKSRPLFESFVIKNIWSLYDLVLNEDTEKISKFAAAFKLKDLSDSQRVNISKDIKDKKKCISYLMSQWLPLDRAILASAVQWLPSPIAGQKERLSVISKKLAYVKETKNSAEYALMKKAIEECDNSETAPVVAFISKMVCVTKPFFNERNLRSMQDISADPPIRFMGFARLYSGKLTRGKAIYVIGPKAGSKDTNQAKAAGNIFPFDVQHLYMMMGPNYEGINDVYAGNVFSIGGLEEKVFKSASLSSLDCCPSLTPIDLGAKGILKVSLTTYKLDDSVNLIEGLKKLNKSDPSVEVFTESNGDIILSTCGQVHKERCINDLERTMAKVKIIVSDPIIQFKETVISRNMKNKKEGKGLSSSSSSNRENEDGEEEEDIEALKRQAKEKYQKGCEDVEIVDIQGIKEDDIRYGLLDEEKEKAKFKYKVELQSQLKRKDQANRGKSIAMLSRNSLLDIINKKNYICQLTPNGKLLLKVRCVGMKFEFAEWLELSSNRMRKLFFDMSRQRDPKEVKDFLDEFEQRVNEVFPEKKLRDSILSNLVSFGPNKYGPNMLIMNHISKEECLLEKLRKKILLPSDNAIAAEKQVASIVPLLNAFKSWSSIEQTYKVTSEEVQNSIIQGFDMAVQSGPLCLEQMMGVIYIVEDIQVIEEEKKESEKKEGGLPLTSSDQLSEGGAAIGSTNKLESTDNLSEVGNEDASSSNPQNIDAQIGKSALKDPFGPLNGQIISTMKDSCFECFLGAQPRLVEGMYMCHVQTSQENYGKSFEVLNKKRARILEEELQESSNIFIIRAHLPVYESLDFYSLMQDNTSGRINSQLVFDTWKIIETDPFYVPVTQEDMEEHGDKLNVPNFAKDLIEKIRKRKGLFTEEKIVVAAEKQRNLSKKK